jgi:Domain of unknown function (DUF4389)
MAEAAENKAPAKKTTPKKTTVKKTAVKKKPVQKKPAAAAKTASKKAPAKKTAVKKKAPAVKKVQASSNKPQTTPVDVPAAEKVVSENTAQESQSAEKSEANPSSSMNEEKNASSTSSFDSEALINELKDKDWGTIATRAFFMVFFGFLANLALMATFLFALAQFIIMVGTGKPNGMITSVVSRLARYIGQALDFLSFKSEDRPFPLDLDMPGED